MDPKVTFVLFIGLCLDWVIRAQKDPLPKPTLRAFPSPVVSKGADVTLRCQGRLGNDRFQLWKDGELREERNASWQLVEFVFRNMDDKRDMRNYSCRARQGPLWSEFSEPLDLVVMTDGETEARRMDALPKPSIRASSGSTVSPGTTVTIRCQTSAQESSQNYSFALLEAKTLGILQVQTSAGAQVVFTLHSLKAEDTGKYSCIYYEKTAPHRGSHPSDTLELTVSGQLPKPTLWAQSGLVVAKGATIILVCSRPKLYSIEEVTFTLWKTGTQEPLQHQTSAELWTSFLLTSVGPDDAGSYNCTYREQAVSPRASETSDALKLVVTGSLPKPSLLVLPALMVEPGTHVTLQCWEPLQSFLWGATFTLLKVGSPQPLQSQSPAGTSADFPLLSVRAQDAGNYSCVYQERMAPYRVSDPSEVLEIWVTDVLPKPSLSSWPGPDVASGANVTLLCQGPSWATRIVLYKERDGKIPLRMDTNQDGAQFFLTHVTPEHSGIYSCSYELSTNRSLCPQHSDPLQLIVRGSVPSNTLIIILSCVSFLLLLFCLLLMAFLCQGSISMGFLKGYSPRRCLCCPCLPWSTHLPHEPETHREETLSTELTERQREPSVHLAEDSQGMTYSLLDIEPLNKRDSTPNEKPTVSTLYAFGN